MEAETCFTLFELNLKSLVLPMSYMCFESENPADGAFDFLYRLFTW